MSNIVENLRKILTARYGRDVRQSIHDAIHDCYEDGRAGATDIVAREMIADVEAQIAPATTEKAGLVKPDGDTITVDADGTIHSAGGDVPNNVTLFEAGDTNQLIDKNGNVLLPITNTKAVYDDEGNRLDNTISTIKNQLGVFDFYNGLSSLGLQNGCHINDIIIKLPNYSVFFQYISPSIVINGLYKNNVSQHTLKIEKIGETTFQIILQNIGNGETWVADYGNDNQVGNWHCLADSSNISDAYNPSKTYAQREFCIYNNTLWKSKVANNAGNTPAEGSYWTSTNVGRELEWNHLGNVTNGTPLTIPAGTRELYCLASTPYYSFANMIIPKTANFSNAGAIFTGQTQITNNAVFWQIDNGKIILVYAIQDGVDSTPTAYIDVYYR